MFKYINIMHDGMEFDVRESQGLEEILNQVKHGSKQFSIDYSLIHADYAVNPEYMRKVEQERNDFRRNVPLKDVLHIPKSGLLGFTYIGSRFIFTQDDHDLQDMKEEVHIHEPTHRESEYETRICTRVKIDISLMKDYKNRKPLQEYAKLGKDAPY